jgi:hypothetical protein
MGSPRSSYDLELRACFVFTIETELEGPPGLSRDQLEELIEANWLWLSADTDVLLESHWELESFTERSASSREE